MFAPLKLKIKTNKGIKMIISVSPDTTISDLTTKVLDSYRQLLARQHQASQTCEKLKNKEYVISEVKVDGYHIAGKEFVGDVVDQNTEIQCIFSKIGTLMPSQKQIKKQPNQTKGQKRLSSMLIPSQISMSTISKKERKQEKNNQKNVKIEPKIMTSSASNVLSDVSLKRKEPLLFKVNREITKQMDFETYSERCNRQQKERMQNMSDTMKQLMKIIYSPSVKKAEVPNNKLGQKSFEDQNTLERKEVLQKKQNFQEQNQNKLNEKQKQNVEQIEKQQRQKQTLKQNGQKQNKQKQRQLTQKKEKNMIFVEQKLKSIDQTIVLNKPIETEKQVAVRNNNQKFFNDKNGNMGKKKCYVAPSNILIFQDNQKVSPQQSLGKKKINFVLGKLSKNIDKIIKREQITSEEEYKVENKETIENLQKQLVQQKYKKVPSNVKGGKYKLNLSDFLSQV